MPDRGRAPAARSIAMRLWLAVLGSIVLAACALQGPGSTVGPPPAGSAGSPAPVEQPAPSPEPGSPGTPDGAGPGGPPTAALSVEGGDPVDGQLGTYTWGDGGSDSPWLPGSPILVGAGEPLRIAFEPAVVPSTWTARVVPAGADGPGGATILADGNGLPTFAAPGAGRYTLVVEIEVLGLGTAHYAWALDVR